MLILHGLLSRHEFFTDRILFQSIAGRHLPGGALPVTFSG